MTDSPKASVPGPLAPRRPGGADKIWGSRMHGGQAGKIYKSHGLTSEQDAEDHDNHWSELVVVSGLGGQLGGPQTCWKEAC